MSAGREVTTMEFAERPLQRRFGPFMRWCRTWTILAGILLLAFIGSVWMKRDAIPIPQLQTGPQNQDSLSRLFQELYAPIKPAVTQPSVTGTDGKEYRITTEPQWEKSLGSKVLILDMDTRSLHGENQILNNNTVPWENIEQGSSGLLNHYMYCKSSPHTSLSNPALRPLTSSAHPRLLLQTHPTPTSPLPLRLLGQTRGNGTRPPRLPHRRLLRRRRRMEPARSALGMATKPLEHHPLDLPLNLARPLPLHRHPRPQWSQHRLHHRTTKPSNPRNPRIMERLSEWERVSGVRGMGE